MAEGPATLHEEISQELPSTNFLELTFLTLVPPRELRVKGWGRVGGGKGKWVERGEGRERGGLTGPTRASTQ